MISLKGVFNLKYHILRYPHSGEMGQVRYNSSELGVECLYDVIYTPLVELVDTLVLGTSAKALRVRVSYGVQLIF